MKTKTHHEISLRPYNGRLFAANTRKEYEAAHIALFNEPDVLLCDQQGRFSGGKGRDGLWTYLIWANSPSTWAHEVAHVILHTFERLGIDARSGNGEPFCYLLSQILTEVKK